MFAGLDAMGLRLVGSDADKSASGPSTRAFLDLLLDAEVAVTTLSLTSGDGSAARRFFDDVEGLGGAGGGGVGGTVCPTSSEACSAARLAAERVTLEDMRICLLSAMACYPKIGRWSIRQQGGKHASRWVKSTPGVTNR